MAKQVACIMRIVPCINCVLRYHCHLSASQVEAVCTLNTMTSWIHTSETQAQLRLMCKE